MKEIKKVPCWDGDELIGTRRDVEVYGGRFQEGRGVTDEKIIENLIYAYRGCDDFYAVLRNLEKFSTCYASLIIDLKRMRKIGDELLEMSYRINNHINILEGRGRKNNWSRSAFEVLTENLGCRDEIESSGVDSDVPD